VYYCILALLLAEFCELQSEDGAMDCCTSQTGCSVRSALLSPVLDDDDGFVELNDFGSDLQANSCITKCSAADKKTVSCRKRRRVVNDIVDVENFSTEGDTSVDVATSLACVVGQETPTSSKQTVKRAKECTDLSISHDVTRSVYSRAGGRRLVRCNSEAVIHQALSTSEEQSNLIGDFSRPHSLPLLTSVKHQDLKSISPDTVSCSKMIMMHCSVLTFYTFLYGVRNFTVIVTFTVNVFISVTMQRCFPHSLTFLFFYELF